MTLFLPAIKINRLVVHKGATAVYDERFHSGLNVIRGSNGSGKSTIADFVFFVLGGDVPNWKEAAKACDFVSAEVEINGEVGALRRPIESAAQQGLQIFWGTLDDSKDAWKVYPFRRSANKESFSQVLFRALGYPDIPGEAGANITMHQLLRMLYVDQTTPIDKMFRFETYDPLLTRQTVGDFLCGAFDPELYNEQLLLREDEKQLDRIVAEIKSFFRILADQSHMVNRTWIEEQIRDRQQEQARIYRDIASLRGGLGSEKKGGAPDSSRRKQVVLDLKRLDREIESKERRLAAIELEILDSQGFLAQIKSNLRALEQSVVSQAALGEIRFVFCPSCFAPIPQEPSDYCALCKTPRSKGEMGSNLHKMRQELDFQIQESTSLKEMREATRNTLQVELSGLYRERRALGEEYLLMEGRVTTEVEQAIEDKSKRLGYLAREIDDLTEKGELIGRVEQLQDRRDALNSEIGRLKDSIEARKAAQEEQRAQAYLLIGELTRKNIRNDLPREDAFIRAGSVEFSFSDDRVYVDGQGVFSASSMVILKNSFHLAFLEASLKDLNFRYPRFLLLDNVEDKGMEPERSHNFQHMIASISEDAEVDHQIIITTSMVSPEVDTEEYVVGEKYSRGRHSLAGVIV
jgi:hypothetical protein